MEQLVWFSTYSSVILLSVLTSHFPELQLWAIWSAIWNVVSMHVDSIWVFIPLIPGTSSSFCASWALTGSCAAAVSVLTTTLPTWLY